MLYYSSQKFIRNNGSLFLTYLKKVTCYHHFWNSIDTALTSTMACNKSIGNYTSLDASTSIKALLIPPTVHSDFHLCNPTYSQLSRILRDHLLKHNTISFVLPPSSFNTLTRYKIEDDGFKILQKIVFTDSPQLRGEERDLYNYVNSLSIIPDEYLVHFYHREKTMEQEINLQQDTNGHHNRLAKRFIYLITCVP